MSIRSKDLSYDKAANQPAFLQRLRDQNASINASGRHERPIARAQRLRNDQDGDDDAPTYVVEGSSDVLTKAEYEKLTSGGEEGLGQDGLKDKFGDLKDLVTGDLEAQSPKASGALPDADHREGRSARSTVTVDAGQAGIKKRKLAKVVGGGDDDDDGLDQERNPKEKEHGKVKKRPKKTAKAAVKLSFGDEE